jgi:homoaconitate hydratase family protein
MIERQAEKRPPNIDSGYKMEYDFELSVRRCGVGFVRRPQVLVRSRGPKRLAGFESYIVTNMKMTIAQKILASKSGRDSVVPGEIVDAYPDLVMSHTATWRSASAMAKIGATKLYDPERLAIVLDHVSPAKTEKYAADQQISRDFARKHGVRKFYDIDSGIAHLVLMEAGHVAPGDLIVGTDSHCTIYGSLGALGTGIGYTEVASVWITGKLWMKVPETFKIVLNGSFAGGVYSKDLMLYLIGKLGADGCNYKSVEFYGDSIPHLSVSERMTMANIAMEMGVKCVFIPPDVKTAEYLGGRLESPGRYQPVYADPEASYEKEITVAISELEPMVACPHEVENTKPIGQVLGTRIDQAFLGSCANAKFEDLVTASRILKGRRVHPNVRLIITPGSKQIMLEAMNSGVLQILLESGGMVTNPGCGACAGDGGMLADGEVCLSTANRNFVGRMGSNKSQIYLSSPATLAASAIKGEIADPREFQGL